MAQLGVRATLEEVSEILAGHFERVFLVHEREN
jgi:hypothetical protein